MREPIQRMFKNMAEQELKDYVCASRCLSNCPFPDSCIWDDPDIGNFDQVKYPPFFVWRLEHLTDKQKRLLMETGSDIMILTPGCLNQFYPEPEPYGKINRCNRCLSTELEWQAEWIVCKRCGYDEPLHDYPVAVRYER